MATKKFAAKKSTTGKTDSKNKREAIFADGFRIFKKHENAPDFVKGTVCISLESFTEFAEKNSQLLHESETFGTQIFLELKESKEGVLYAEVKPPFVKE